MMVDAIRLEVFKNLFAGVAEEMGETLRRASFSPNIRERLDFSCAVFDAEARMVAQAAHIPVHLGSMPASVAAAVAEFERFQPGDVIVLNDPYRGGTHLPDVTMVSPIFADSELVFFIASRAHHADVGGMSPGSLPLSDELYQEGIIIPPVKLHRAGALNADVLALITANSRAPAERQGDLQAQLAAHRVGEARLREIIQQQGHDATRDYARALMDYAHRMTQAIIARLPDGTYRMRDQLEGDGQTELDVPIQVTITVQGEAMTVAFDGSAPQVAGNVNAVRAIVQSAVWYCVRLLADDDLPVNHGSFAPVKVLTPEQSFLNPRFPAAVAVGNTETAQRVVDVVLGALAQALPERIPAASQGTMNNLTIGGFHLSGPRSGQQFVYYETIGGGHGGGPDGPGISGRQCHMTNTWNTPVEALEHALPLRVWRYSLRDGSGGAGRHPGGAGIIREYELLTPATMTLNSERRRYGPYGLQGGAAGATGRNRIVTAEGESELSGKHTRKLQPGDRILIETPGGGGWGAPDV